MRRSRFLTFNPEIREWAVRVAASETRGCSDRKAVIANVAIRIGCAPKTLERWMLQAELAGGIVPGLFTNPEMRLKGLEQEVAGLKRVNERLRIPIRNLGGVV